MPKGYINTVPQGIAGTGNATIYGDNPVAVQFGNQLAALRQNQYNDEVLKQKAAEQQAALYRANQLKVQGGMLWAPEISKLEQDHIQNGIALQQKGVNPYGSSPDALAYQQRQLEIEAKQDFRKAVEDQAKEREKYIQANIDKLDPNDIKKYHDYLGSAKLDDAFNGNFALPEIRTQFRVNDLIKDVKPATQQVDYTDPQTNIKSSKKFLDFDTTADAILGKMNQDDRGRAELDKLTSGMPVNELRTFSTDLTGNRERVRRELLGNPKQLMDLAKEGIVPGTPQMDNLVDGIAKEQTVAKRKFDEGINGLVSSVSGGLAQFDKSEQVKKDLSDQTLAERIRHDKEMEARARASEARLAAKAGKDEAGDVSTVRQKIVNDIFDGVDGSGEAIKGMVDGSLKMRDKNIALHVTVQDEPGHYSKGKATPDGRYIKFTIPKHTEETAAGTTKEVPENVIVFDKTRPEDKVKMNQFINEVSGENVNTSTLLSEKGKKLITGEKGVPKIREAGKTAEQKFTLKGKAYPQTAVEKAAKASGMSVDEYIKEANR